jgi:pimeloyl-ACP methyl ester carboxylesterase
MPVASSNGIELYYETHGARSDPALLLVNGLGSQIVQWGDGYREALAQRGRFVVSFDNRDVGLSTHFHDAKIDIGAVLAASRSGGPVPAVPYLLADFAADAVGLLDHLEIGAAHIAGSSMGGMIVQQMAIDHPTRVLTMTSVMSTTGEPDFFKSSPETGALFNSPPPTERQAYIDHSLMTSRASASPRYFNPVEVGARIGRAYDRAFDQPGRLRQLAAIHASGHRADALRKLDVPTLVIHGRADTLILPPGGERTAELVPGANLLLLTDMGHDLPRPLWPIIHDAIISHTTHAIGGRER